MYERGYAFLGAGFCGGLTTFSTFSLQGIELLGERVMARLFAVIFASVSTCLLACFAGHALAERWLG